MMAETKEPVQDYKAGIEDLADDLKAYVNTSAELYKMQATAKGAELGAEMIIGLIAGVFIAMAFLFASFAAAYSISAWIGKEYAGFLIVAGAYALLAVIVLLFKGKGLKTTVSDFIVKQLYAKDHD